MSVSVCVCVHVFVLCLCIVTVHFWRKCTVELDLIQTVGQMLADAWPRFSLLRAACRLQNPSTSFFMRCKWLRVLWCSSSSMRNSFFRISISGGTSGHDGLRGGRGGSGEVGVQERTGNCTGNATEELKATHEGRSCCPNGRLRRTSSASKAACGVRFERFSRSDGDSSVERIGLSLSTTAAQSSSRESNGTGRSSRLQRTARAERSSMSAVFYKTVKTLG